MSETSPDTFYISGMVLHVASQEWREQRDALTVASAAIKNAPREGFGQPSLAR